MTIFTTLRVVRGEILLWPDHVRRLGVSTGALLDAVSVNGGAAEGFESAGQITARSLIANIAAPGGAWATTGKPPAVFFHIDNIANLLYEDLCGAVGAPTRTCNLAGNVLVAGNAVDAVRVCWNGQRDFGFVGAGCEATLMGCLHKYLFVEATLQGCLPIPSYFIRCRSASAAMKPKAFHPSPEVTFSKTSRARAVSPVTK